MSRSDQTRYFHAGLRRTDHGKSVFVDEPDLVGIFEDDAKAVEASNVPLDRGPRNKKRFNLDSGFSDLIQKLVLNIEVCLRHFSTPAHVNPRLLGPKYRNAHLIPGENPPSPYRRERK